MAYAYQSTTPLVALAQTARRAVASLSAASDRIVADRRHAAAALEAKSDAELARLGLQRAQIAQDVHRHLYYS